jgi:hypothetical protein
MIFIAAALSAAFICIERLEANGSVNVYPVSAQIDGDSPWLRANRVYWSQQKPRRIVALSGGEERCLSVESGVHVIGASWPQFDWKWPDHGANGDSFLTSKEMMLDLKPGETAKLLICSTRDANQVPAWDVHRSGDDAACE